MMKNLLVTISSSVRPFHSLYILFFFFFPLQINLIYGSSLNVMFSYSFFIRICISLIAIVLLLNVATITWMAWEIQFSICVRPLKHIQYIKFVPWTIETSGEKKNWKEATLQKMQCDDNNQWFKTFLVLSFWWERKVKTVRNTKERKIKWTKKKAITTRPIFKAWSRKKSV